jgi:peptidoglycan hydrolase-like protein with peptidoglycan-binding domain
MAYKAAISNENISDLCLQGVSHFWAIHQGVGWGYNNNYDDVLLIQFLLNSNGAGLVEDGIFGKKTQKAIRVFQKKFKLVLFVDGKVDANDGSDYDIQNGNQVNNLYTILVLNYCYKENKNIYYSDLRMDPKLPQSLCHLLSV